MFGQYTDFARRVIGRTFRKGLVMDFKQGKKDTHKNPHSLPMNTKQLLLQKKRGGDWDRIRELEQRSSRPFGRFVRHKFILEDDKIPKLDIPDLEGFTLQPYVYYLTPKVDKSTIPSPRMRLKKQPDN